MTLGPGGTAQLAVKPGREWTEPLEWAGLAVEQRERETVPCAARSRWVTPCPSSWGHALTSLPTPRGAGK